jgi:hypothetical protein
LGFFSEATPSLPTTDGSACDHQDAADEFQAQVESRGQRGEGHVPLCEQLRDAGDAATTEVPLVQDHHDTQAGDAATTEVPLVQDHHDTQANPGRQQHQVAADPDGAGRPCGGRAQCGQ